MKRVFIVHGWDSSPGEAWFPWLKQELEKKGYMAEVLEMPSPEAPAITSWVSVLKEHVGEIDNETSFVGHSIGCQTILRFLAGIDNDITIDHTVLVAPWLRLTPASTPDEETQEIARPWIAQPLDWNTIRRHIQDVTCIFSDDDPFVYADDAPIFEKELHAKSIHEHEKGHIGGDVGIMELPSALIPFV